MSTKVEPARGTSGADIAKYAVALLLLVGGIAGFYWFENQWPTAIRALLVTAGVLLAALVFATTAKGMETREFLSESRFELRKVVWPTRQEALRTTWVVMIAVVVISLMLAGFDAVIQWVIKLLLGR